MELATQPSADAPAIARLTRSPFGRLAPIVFSLGYNQEQSTRCHGGTHRPEAVNEIAIAPITLQEEIPKKYEIRVNVVGQQVLAIKIDSQNSQISKLDWRRYDLENTPYLPYTLPADIQDKCIKLVQRLGLQFGAIDLIFTPDGEYIFLEINGNGNFLWAEELSGVKVSSALANLLAGKRHR